MDQEKMNLVNTVQWFSKCDPRSVALASGNLLETQILSPYPRLTESEIRRVIYVNSRGTVSPGVDVFLAKGRLWNETVWS